jgi:hypothetical protein
MDLATEQRMKVVTQLLIALDENAFILAGVLDAPNVVLESSDIMSKQKTVQFPAIISATGFVEGSKRENL